MYTKQLRKYHKLYLGAAHEDTTKESYATGVKHWLKFCLIYHADPLHFNELILSDFAIHRARFDHVKQPTIRGNIFHIRHYLLVNTYKTFSFSDVPYLKLILSGIKKLDPIPLGTVPLTHDLVIKIVNKAEQLKQTQNRWFYYVFQVMVIFAWAFCLRCSEYTRTKYWDAPLLNAISFSKTKEKCPCLNYKLDRRKNKVHDEVEPICIPCTCEDFGICGLHTIQQYLQDRKKQNVRSKYLFCYNYRGTIKSFSASSFRRILKDILKSIYKKEYNPKIHRAHGFRYGGITDLGTIGIPHDLIRRISGHAPDSKVLLQYLKLAPEAVASLIKTNADRKLWSDLLKKL